MPTGYTSGVASGKITDFKEYALQCARAFGACIELRDDELSSEIPEFEPSTHNADRLSQAQKELAEWTGMKDEQLLAKYHEATQEQVRHAKERIAENDEQRKRYEAMLAEAKRFRAPSADHHKYAGFLVSQLEDSIKFDCNGSYYVDQLTVPPFKVWKNEKRKSLMRDIEYHSKAQREEEERTAQRNKWVRQLKEALGVVAESV